jgi:hypothetical protein
VKPFYLSSETVLPFKRNLCRYTAAAPRMAPRLPSRSPSPLRLRLRLSPKTLMPTSSWASYKDDDDDRMEREGEVERARPPAEQQKNNTEIERARYDIPKAFTAVVPSC